MIAAMSRRRTCCVRRGLWLFVALLATVVEPRAHDLERTTVHLRVAADGAFALRLAHDPSWLLLRMESFAASAPALSERSESKGRDARLRALAPQMIDRVVLWIDGREVRPASAEYAPPPASVPAGEFALASYTLRGQLPASARGLRWYYGMAGDPYPFTVELPDGSSNTEWVQGDAWSTTLALGGPFVRPSLLTRLRDYVVLGYTHILPKGLDHILFVIGLFLLSARWRPVLAQVTTFTIAHSITLGLSLYGLVSLPSGIVEPLIALSIAYVAVENLRTRALTWTRLVLVFLFGLLHGMGFAGVLTALELPPAEFAAALFGFNVGVELGQISVIAAAALLVVRWRERSWYHVRIVVPASVLIACVGVYWAVLRSLGPAM
jgi:hydrogenase/urease accessory protein HupE